MGPGRVKTPNLVFSPGFGGTGMKRFVEGQDRSQLILLPDCLDDYVGEDNPIRIVDAFIDELDLAVLGFAGVVPEMTGRPSYHPVMGYPRFAMLDLLKLLSGLLVGLFRSHAA